jgi:hypothetical protein
MAPARQGVLYRLRRNLAEMLNPAAPEPVKAPRAPRGLRPANVRGEAAVEDRLRDLLGQAGDAAVHAGRVNFISLEKLKDRLGARWERVAASADRVARQTIERHLEPGDISSGLPNFSHIIVFARMSPQQARVKCLLIAEQISKTLLGEGTTEQLEVKVATARADGGIDLKPISLADELTSSLDAGGDLELVEREPVAAAAEPPKPAAALSTAAAASKQDPLAKLSFSYRPVWDKTRNVVSAYSCMAQVRLSDVGPAADDAAAMIGDDPLERARLDDMVQERVIADINDLMRDGLRVLLVLPVHFETLSSVARRRKFAKVLSERLGEEPRKRLLIEIDGVPVGVMQSRLVELITPLRALCRGVMLRFSLETTDFACVKGCGAFAIGATVGGRVEPEFTLMLWMNRFARAAEKAGTETYAHGLRSLSQVAGAIGAGFGYLDGDAVAKPVAHPRRAVEFRLDDLYNSFGKS